MSNYNVLIIKCGGGRLEDRERIASKLAENIQFKLLRYCGRFKIIVRGCEVLIYSEDPLSMLKHITTVFGVKSIIPAIEVNTDIHEIVDIGSQAVAGKIGGGDTFTVKARGKFKNLIFTSRDVEVCLSAEILLKTEEVGVRNVRTSLRKPHIRVFVDVKNGKSHIYFEKYKGIGGLPYGIRGKILSIISPDIKSAVSTWITAREGYIIVPIQFSLGRYASRGYEVNTINTLSRIREYIPEEKLKVYLFNHTYSIRKIIKEVPREIMCTVCKVVMYKVAENLCREIKANGIIAYENRRVKLSAIDKFINVPLLRPLNRLSKYRIREVTKRIGLNNGLEVLECTLAPRRHTIGADVDTVMEILEDIKWINIVNREYKTLKVKELN
jgi:thiamine biosynthesis protein ThiI